MSVNTHDFGLGPVPAHRHSNGGGWVADSANVSDRTYVGPLARVAGGTIEGGTIRGGTIRGGTIRGGTIEGGTIRGGTIWGGTIRGGTIWGGTIEGTRDLLVVGPVGSEDQILTLARDPNQAAGHRVSIGCWNNEGQTVDDILPEVERRCPDHLDEYSEIIPILQRRVNEWAAS